MGWWDIEPPVGRVAHGVPQRVDRLRSLGNSLVPQIAEWIGLRIVSYEAMRQAA
jgi:DNA (cytosine-5)-methyltransferase 1